MRYCDDFVVLCPTRERAEQARELAGAVLGGLGLRLHPGKTGIVHLARGGRGLVFLGFHHREVESWRRRGRFHLQRWPSQRAMGVLRDKIRVAIDRRRVGRPLSAVVADLNPVLRGWAAYFRWGNSAGKFSAIDSYVHHAMKYFRSRRGAQKFLSVFSQVSPHFRPRRHLLTAAEYRTEMHHRFETWNEITGTTAMPTTA